MASLARAALVLLLLLPYAARADNSQKDTGEAWRQTDRCAHEAFQKYPDYTPQSNAKREARLKECLAGANLPPRQPLSPGQ